MTDTTRRDQYICAALTGLLSDERMSGDERFYAKVAAGYADAALAAAGEKEPEVVRTPCDDCLSARRELEAEIARLKRQAEPLTEGEAAPLGGTYFTPADMVSVDRAITAVKARRV